MRWSGDPVVTGEAARDIPKAVIDHDLRSDAVRHSSRVDPRLFDPRLAQHYEEAAAQARELGRAEGFTLGYAQGLAKAAAEAERDMEQATQMIIAREADRERDLASVLDRLRIAVDAFEASTVTAYVDAAVGLGPAAYSLVRVLLGHELALSEDELMDAVRRVASRVPYGSSVVLHVCPADMAAMTERSALIEEVLGRAALIVSDPSLSPGDVIADSGASRIDARLGPALARVAEILDPEGASAAAATRNMGGRP